MAIIDVIIPAFNEESSIPLVIRDIPAEVRTIYVCNNGSTDQTASVAKKAGAVVLNEPRKGYGSACLKGIAEIEKLPVEEQPDIVVFMDGDYSDHPDELPNLVRPILEDDMDLVIGSRALGNLDPGSMTVPQVFGNWLATNLLEVFYGYKFTDLGPFRAIKWPVLQNMGMCDPDFGWTVEMQIRAAKAKLKCIEVPVTYRKRVGVSKVSGTVKGTILAGHKILWTLFKLL
jgi:glycosyltransferase involved in cell wall biosynthesis